jgi:phenylalanyl-tRNA synthetase beta subunit
LITAQPRYGTSLSNIFYTIANRTTKPAKIRNPKKFWNSIRKCSNIQRSKVDVPLDELFEYFKDLNFIDDNEIDHNNNFVEVNVEVVDRILNSHISASEIEETVRK